MKTKKIYNKTRIGSIASYTVSILSSKLRMPRAHACTIIPRRQHMDCLKIKNPPLSQDFDGFWSECGDSHRGPPAPKRLN